MASFVQIQERTKNMFIQLLYSVIAIKEAWQTIGQRADPNSKIIGINAGKRAERGDGRSGKARHYPAIQRTEDHPKEALSSSNRGPDTLGNSGHKVPGTRIVCLTPGGWT